jgi:transposase
MAGMTSYLPYEPRRQQLLPNALQDWLPEEHLAYDISDVIGSLDLCAFHARYEDGGPRNQPFHPAMMVKVLVYGYATGVFSSRKIDRKLHEDVAFRVLAAGNFPAHRTICDFRALHLKELSALFVQVVKLARECGLVKLGTISVDGTKIKANASRHKAMSYERMQRAEVELKGQIEALLAHAKAADEAERNEPELDVPAEIARRQQRLEVIRAARERLEERQKAADPRAMNASLGMAMATPKAVARTLGISGSGTQGAGELHRSAKPHHEACWRRLRLLLQRARGGGRYGAHRCGGGTDQPWFGRRAPGADAGGGAPHPGRASAARTGRCGISLGSGL